MWQFVPFYKTTAVVGADHNHCPACVLTTAFMSRASASITRARRVAQSAREEMVAIIDIRSALDKLTLDGLSSRSSGADRKASFDRLARFRDSGVFSAKFAGQTPWERHPGGDELVHIVEGAAMFHSRQ